MLGNWIPCVSLISKIEFTSTFIKKIHRATPLLGLVHFISDSIYFLDFSSTACILVAIWNHSRWLRLKSSLMHVFYFQISFRFSNLNPSQVLTVAELVKSAHSFRCFLKGPVASPLAQFGDSPEHENDSGDGGGVPVFTFFSISHFGMLSPSVNILHIRLVLCGWILGRIFWKRNFTAFSIFFSWTFVW